MKKFLCLAIAMISIFCVIACNRGNDLPPVNGNDPQNTAAATVTDAPKVVIDAVGKTDFMYAKKDGYSWKCSIKNKDIVRVEIDSKEEFHSEDYPNVDEKVVLKFTAISVGKTDVTLTYYNSETKDEIKFPISYRVVVNEDNTIDIFDVTEAETQTAEFLENQPNVNFYTLYSLANSEGEQIASFEDLVRLGFTPGDAWLSVRGNEMLMFLGMDEPVHFTFSDNIMMNDAGGQFYFQAEEKDSEDAIFGKIIVVSDGENMIYEFRRMLGIEDEFHKLLDDFDILYEYMRNSGIMPQDLYEGIEEVKTDDVPEVEQTAEPAEGNNP